MCSGGVNIELTGCLKGVKKLTRVEDTGQFVVHPLHEGAAASDTDRIGGGRCSRDGSSSSGISRRLAGAGCGGSEGSRKSGASTGSGAKTNDIRERTGGGGSGGRGRHRNLRQVGGYSTGRIWGRGRGRDRSRGQSRDRGGGSGGRGWRIGLQSLYATGRGGPVEKLLDKAANSHNGGAVEENMSKGRKKRCNTWVDWCRDI